MTNSDRQGRSLPALAGCDIDALVFIAEMYGVQLDHLAVILGVSVERARGVVLRWRHLGLAESARLGPGPPWIWATRPGLAPCRPRHPAGPPALAPLGAPTGAAPDPPTLPRPPARPPPPASRRRRRPR